MRIYLVRHSQSEGNIDKSKYFEKLDCEIEITEKGKGQAISAADRIMDLNDHFVHKNDPDYPYPSKNPPYRFNMYHSSYTRARQTANIIHGRMMDFEGYHIEGMKESLLLREREWGSLRDIVEMGQKNEEHFNFYYKPQGGESFADCFNRVALFHQWFINDTKYENNIIVAHGEFNKLYAMHLLGWTVKEFDKWKNPRNGEVWVIENNELSSLTPLIEKHTKI